MKKKNRIFLFWNSNRISIIGLVTCETPDMRQWGHEWWRVLFSGWSSQLWPGEGTIPSEARTLPSFISFFFFKYVLPFNNSGFCFNQEMRCKNGSAPLEDSYTGKACRLFIISSIVTCYYNPIKMEQSSLLTNKKNCSFFPIVRTFIDLHLVISLSIIIFI